ncbi:MAG: ABC transporter ATP-binding protein [Alphaproteobacteria bacterium]|nr:ABC transporter ATP-binding protein [Alphaproteobacteria bacterium]
MPDALLSVEGLRKSFPGRGGGLSRRAVRAVADVSFHLRRGETLGLVGESGCGKSTLARLVLHLIAPDGGSVLIDGTPFTGASERQRRKLRRRLQIVFQDALSSLNPRMTVGVNIAEPMRLQGLGTPAERHDAARELLQLVGLRAGDAARYPHEFSGGQCQRIAIARALILHPDIVVFDEAVSALDVSIRSQILRLILDLQQRLGLSYIFISHDLGVVKRVADRIAVMYLGRIVEIGPAEDVVRNPQHPYTRALLRAIPIADPRRMRVQDLGLAAADVASQAPPAAGCAFQPRCTLRLAVCVQEVPPTVQVAPGHTAMCHHVAPGNALASRA